MTYDKLVIVGSVVFSFHRAPAKFSWAYALQSPVIFTTKNKRRHYLVITTHKTHGVVIILQIFVILSSSEIVVVPLLIRFCSASLSSTLTCHNFVNYVLNLCVGTVYCLARSMENPERWSTQYELFGEAISTN